VGIWSELKRRNVVKVAIAYLALAWMVIQITSVAVPALNLPETLNSIVFYLGLIGFPFALFFAWAFELTPDGLKKSSDVDTDQSTTEKTGNMLEHGIVVLLVGAVGFMVWEDYFYSGAADVPEQEVITSGVSTASVAVLPFVNMSADKEQEYFSDGISEEILNVLAKIPNLHVTSRSSSFAFKGEKIDLREVAKKLGVAHILEGSVRKSGTTVRITAQLIEAKTDKHLWSETYDRELDDVFKIQDELSVAIAAILKVKLLGEEDTASIVPQTINPDAYNAYLQGSYLWRNNDGWEEADRARDLILKSIDLDDSFAPSHSKMANIYSMYGMNAKMPLEEGTRLAVQEINRALELDPDLADAYLVRGRLRGNLYFDFSGQRKDLEHANRLLPNNSDIYRALSYNSVAFGEFDKSMVQALKAIALDPLNPRMFSLEGRVLYYQGRFAEALEIFKSRLLLTPNSQGVLLNVGYTQLALGMYSEAMETAAIIDDEAYNPQVLAMVYHGLGKLEESEEELQRLIKNAADDSAYQIAEVYCFRNELAKCFEWIDISFKQLDPGLQNLSTSPFLKSSHTDPRYEMYLGKLNQPSDI